MPEESDSQMLPFAKKATSLRSSGESERFSIVSFRNISLISTLKNIVKFNLLNLFTKLLNNNMDLG